MDTITSQIYQVLNQLLGLHRQLMDTVRSERSALASANLSGIQEATYTKEGLIESIRQQEAKRRELTTQLAASWKRPLKDLTLPGMIIAIQGRDLKAAEQFRSVFNALTILIRHITDQNASNRALIEKSLEHLTQMKKNVLGESVPKSNTYNQAGQRANSAKAQSRLISQEA